MNGLKKNENKSLAELHSVVDSIVPHNGNDIMIHRNYMAPFFFASLYPINDCKLKLVCLDEVSVINCSSINHNNPVQ